MKREFQEFFSRVHNSKKLDVFTFLPLRDEPKTLAPVGINGEAQIQLELRDFVWPECTLSSGFDRKLGARGYTERLTIS